MASSASPPYRLAGDWSSVWWLPSEAAQAEPGRQCAVRATEEAPIDHLAFVPAGPPPPGGWPLVLFLHGQGEAAPNELRRVATIGVPQLCGRHPDRVPFAVLSPQKWLFDYHHDDKHAERIMKMVDSYIDKFALDPRRVYITGISAGGTGCWMLASDPRYAHRFAAAAPVCGRFRYNVRGDSRARAKRLADTPLWVFHGHNDKVVDIDIGSDEAVKYCNEPKRTEYASFVKYSRFEAPADELGWAAARATPKYASGIIKYEPMEGHCSWVKAYYPPDEGVLEAPLFAWMLSHARDPVPPADIARHLAPLDDYATAGPWDTLWWFPRVQDEPIVGELTAIPGESESHPATIGHLFYLPNYGVPMDGNSGWPLILFMHGGGEASPQRLENVAMLGVTQLVGRHSENFPFAVLAPQGRAHHYFHEEEVQSEIVKLLDHYMTEYPIDPERVYLTGCSMGGTGAWMLGSDPRYARRFAAIAPVCGRLRCTQSADAIERATMLCDTPIWTWHGVKDEIIGVKHTDATVRLIEAVSDRTEYAGDVRYSRLEECESEDYAWPAARACGAGGVLGMEPMPQHCAWMHAYCPRGVAPGAAELFRWFLRHRRAGARVGGAVGPRSDGELWAPEVAPPGCASVR